MFIRKLKKKTFSLLKRVYKRIKKIYIFYLDINVYKEIKNNIFSIETWIFTREFKKKYFLLKDVYKRIKKNIFSI
jgi:hypothetical protein